MKMEEEKRTRNKQMKIEEKMNMEERWEGKGERQKWREDVMQRLLMEEEEEDEEEEEEEKGSREIWRV
ncbi:hypothetical protein E2C01_081125 [Portunus trituberculatus]|uniref:Uncharacterized protein n=1 Tax=Portunus trituberculatus TaxID=210409 RepID=A0A5B7IR44_PORTR|nr:hypothetical protein [Portunus trituberculatus]